jgi:DNA-binding NtrC family response regulator
MLNAKNVLVVEDRSNTLKVISAILKDEGYEVLAAEDGARALDLFLARDDIHLVLSDLKMPKMDGLTLFREMQAIRKPPPFIIMTAYGTVKSAVQALREGVAHYLIKPLDFDELVIVLDKAIREHTISQELTALKRQIGGKDVFHGMIGSDSKMLDIFEMVKTVGPTDVSVLIYGETGTGKELLARALHEESLRKNKPMVCINSAALTENLLEAELFGHVKGAFTGAAADRKGRLETAHEGTLFLDEIGHMSLNLQAKLLRFLQDMTFEPVGGSESRSVDVRVIAATNLDLQKQIESGRFLNDLLYRLEVVPISVPALRDRREDICLLADHFVRQFSGQYNKPVRGIAGEAMEVLTDYDWPGNIRELKNSLARAVILSRDARITVANLPKKILAAVCEAAPGCGPELIGPIPEKGVTLREMEIELIRKTLEKCAGNKSLSAQQLGISRKTLYEKIQRHGIEAAEGG